MKNNNNPNDYFRNLYNKCDAYGAVSSDNIEEDFALKKMKESFSFNEEGEIDWDSTVQEKFGRNFKSQIKDSKQIASKSLEMVGNLNGAVARIRTDSNALRYKVNAFNDSLEEIDGKISNTDLELSVISEKMTFNEEKANKLKVQIENNKENLLEKDVKIKSLEADKDLIISNSNKIENELSKKITDLEEKCKTNFNIICAYGIIVLFSAAGLVFYLAL